VAPASGRIHSVILPEKLKYGYPYEKMLIVPSSQGSGITHFWMGVCNLDGEVLGVTADDTNPTGNGAFINETTGQGGAMRLLTEPYTPEVDEHVWLFFCIVATSMPGVMRPSHGNVNIGPPYLGQNSGNESPFSFTTPPEVGAVLTQITNPGVNTGTRWYMAIG
jgi:hypothetical protein